jgi:hypothetical protein
VYQIKSGLGNKPLAKSTSFKRIRYVDLWRERLDPTTFTSKPTQNKKKIYGGVVLALIEDAPIMKKYKRNILNVNKYLVYIWTFYIRTRSFAAIFLCGLCKRISHI